MLFLVGSIFFMIGNQAFPKSERLNGKKNVDLLFSSDEKWLVYPFRIIIQQIKKETFGEFESPKVLFSVSKRLFKKAHERNKVKRLSREAYRTQKANFITSISNRLSKNETKQLHIGFIYVGKKIEAYSFISQKMKKALKEIAEKTS